MEKSTFLWKNRSSSSQFPPPSPPQTEASKAVVKKTRLWLRIDRQGQLEMMECDRSVIIKRASVPARDLRILGPIFSHSSAILAREKAMILNLEFIKAIVTADEVLLLEPLRHEVLPYVDQLRRQLLHKSRTTDEPADCSISLPLNGQLSPPLEGWEEDLPFEFQVLETALEAVCTYLDSGVTDLEREAYPALDELTINVNTKNLERVRSLKSNLTHLLAHVQKVRDEMEHLLDNDEDMAQLYLTRKRTQNQQSEALSSSKDSDILAPAVAPATCSWRSSYIRCENLLMSRSSKCKWEVEELEMLLEAYFMHLDLTRNKILSVREYIDDTEDYVNIQLDNKRNELIQLQLMITITSFAVAVETLVTGILGMNIPIGLRNVHGIFGLVVGCMTAATAALFLLIWGYARWNKLVGS
ncbi:magnesium transporter MRS2-4-like [Andrographis paniculata]|uniref:magnesium transporter MRS2-4-like n=1 Tax=Andrographis paniculata TaxID=175694 RepID=UPI0021E7B0F0|nr:magnesium transporter MRS2-4-like [Andrographis paniculata]